MDVCLTRGFDGGGAGEGGKESRVKGYAGACVCRFWGGLLFTEKCVAGCVSCRSGC